MEIKIIYEDGNLLVIDKPSGVVVNRSDTTKDEETVQDWAEKKLGMDSAEVAPPGRGSQRDNLEQEFRGRAGIVHRLDKETSGILLIAKNPSSFVNLQKQFKERRVEKAYVALVHGLVKPS